MVSFEKLSVVDADTKKIHNNIWFSKYFKCSKILVLHVVYKGKIKTC